MGEGNQLVCTLTDFIIGVQIMPKRRRKRSEYRGLFMEHPRYKRLRMITFLNHLKKLPNVARACKKSLLSKATVYKLRKEDPVFRKLWDENKEIGVQLVDDIILEEAIVYKDRKLLALAAKAYNPKYNEKQEGGVQIDFEEVRAQLNDTLVSALTKLARAPVDPNQITE